LRRNHQTYASAKRAELARAQEKERNDLEKELAAKHGKELADFQNEIAAKFTALKQEAANLLKGNSLEEKYSELDEAFAKELGQKRSELIAKQRTEKDSEFAKLGERLKGEMERLEKQLEAKLVDDMKALEAGSLKPVQAPAPAVTKEPTSPYATGLRREGRLPVGERKEYTHRFFGTGEVRQQIDARPEIAKREPHQAVITFWIEEAKGKKELKLRFNGQPAQNLAELEKSLSDFRLKLIAENYPMHAEAVIDQVGEAPLKAVDDILTVCFRAGIKEVKMSWTGSEKEQ
jgi:hypothetical protein